MDSSLIKVESTLVHRQLEAFNHYIEEVASIQGKLALVEVELSQALVDTEESILHQESLLEVEIGQVLLLLVAFLVVLHLDCTKELLRQEPRI